MDWLKKHADTAVVLGSLFSAMLWMNGKFNDVDSQFHNLEKDMAVIKTVLVMKNLMPVELAHCPEDRK